MKKIAFWGSVIALTVWTLAMIVMGVSLLGGLEEEGVGFGGLAALHELLGFAAQVGGGGGGGALGRRSGGGGSRGRRIRGCCGCGGCGRAVSTEGGAEAQQGGAEGAEGREGAEAGGGFHGSDGAGVGAVRGSARRQMAGERQRVSAEARRLPATMRGTVREGGPRQGARRPCCSLYLRGRVNSSLKREHARLCGGEAAVSGRAV